MTGEMIPVEEYSSLSRDTHSNSIINTDRDAYLKAKMQRNAIVQQKVEHAQMKNQIDELIRRCDLLESELSKLRCINS
jgi:hypothetical protein